MYAMSFFSPYFTCINIFEYRKIHNRNQFRIAYTFIQGHVKSFNAYTFLKRDLRRVLYGMGLHRQPRFRFN